MLKILSQLIAFAGLSAPALDPKLENRIQIP
jgi:hypothetical protein